jgi:hypothetical protein
VHVFKERGMKPEVIKREKGFYRRLMLEQDSYTIVPVLGASIAADLDLTNEQISVFSQILFDLRDFIKPLRQQ